jgi:methyl-accepting chemotaxis protein
MTEEEYLRMKNILNTVIEQQAVFEENHRKAEERMAATDRRMNTNAEGIAALLIIAQMHEQEITKTNEQMNRRSEQLNTRFEQIASRFEEIGKKSAETDERINALVNVVERYISKN